jgi:hypothetical protein
MRMSALCRNNPCAGQHFCKHCKREVAPLDTENDERQCAMLLAEDMCTRFPG